MKMKKSIQKFFALCTAAVMSAICLCTTVSAEEYSAPAACSDAAAEEHPETVERVISAPGTYYSGSSYITLSSNGNCYFHIVYTNGMYVRANGTYAVSGNNFVATLYGYLVVDKNGNMQSSSTATLGVDGSFNAKGDTLTIGGTSYLKG